MRKIGRGVAVRGSVLIPLIFVLSSLSLGNPRWIALDGVSDPTRAGVQLEASDYNEVILGMDLKGFSCEVRQTKGGSFTELRIDEYGFTPQIGRAKLPVIRKMVMIPYGAEATLEVTRTEAHRVNLGTLGITHPVVPVQPPIPKIEGGQGRVPFQKDEAYYSTDSFTPRGVASLGPEKIMRGCRFVTVEFFPISYNPVRAELKVYSEIKIRITLSGGDLNTTAAKLQRYASPPFRGECRNMFLNYSDYESLIKSLPSLPIGYLIITHDSYEGSLQPLVEWKERKGFLVTVARTSEIGSSTAQIQDYIEDAYNNGDIPPTYVLLVGDVNLISCFNAGSRPTDLYYSTIEGSDYVPDVKVGRLSPGSVADVDAIIEKWADYETADWTSPQGWTQRAYFMASNDPGFHGVAEGTHSYCMALCRAHGMTCDSLYAYYGTGTPITTALNNGRTLAVYSGHGSTYGWGGPSFGISQINALTNLDMYPLVISHACITGNYTAGECFGEAWVRRANKGGLAFWGSSVNSYWNEDDILQRRMFDALLDSSITWLAGMMDNAKVALGMHYNWGGLTMAYFEQYNLMGDPSLDLFTAVPRPLTVSHQPMVFLGQTDFWVNVYSLEDEPLANAIVCARNEELFAVGYTDETGTAILQFDPAPSQAGGIELVVTAHNALPYIDTVQVGGGYGVLTGAVTDAATGDSLAEAVVTVGEIGLVDTTGEDGLFLFEEVPEWNYTVTVTREGYLDWYQEGVVVDSGQTTVLDAGLLHPEFVVDVDSSGIHITLLPGGETNVVFNILNPGNGPLEYGIGLEYPGWTDSVNLDQPLFSYDLGMLTGDERLLGVEFDSSFFYVSGANNSAQPNYIYVFDRDGNLVRAFEQPGGSAGWGFRDLAWDGQFLYGSFGPEITVFDPVGNYVGGIPGPIQPSRAIAYDPGTDHFWVAGVNTGLYEIDRQGDVISSYPCSLRVYGLAWRGDDLEGANLHLFSREGTDQVSTVSKFNPSRGELIPLGSLPFMDGDRAMGAALTGDWIPAKWVLLGLINGPTVRLEGYIVGDNLIWVRPSPREGTVAGGEAQSVIVHLNTVGLEEGTYTGEIHIQHSAVGEEGVIPVTLTVQGLSVSEEESFGLPTDYELFQNYPNPFNPSTTIRYGLPEPGRVTLKVYNISGQEVATLADEHQPAGYHQISWDATGHSSGIYFYQIQAGEFQKVRKIIFLK